jgi:hypothetical protein
VGRSCGRVYLKIDKGRGYLTDELVDGRYELLLLGLSTYILREKLPTATTHNAKLAVAGVDVELLRRFCLLCEYELSRDIRRRKKVRQETQAFAKLLRDKDMMLREKERTRKTNIDFDQLNKDCLAEETRWERNWTAIKGEWVLESLKATLSRTPPTDFFSQPYDVAFHNHSPAHLKPPTTVIQSACSTSQTNISHLLTVEKDLEEEIKLLEIQVGKETPPRRGSLRRSLPATRAVTPSPEKTSQVIQFQRSMSRLGSSGSESPHRLLPEHGSSRIC